MDLSKQFPGVKTDLKACTYMHTHNPRAKQAFKKEKGRRRIMLLAGTERGKLALLSKAFYRNSELG